MRFRNLFALGVVALAGCRGDDAPDPALGRSQVALPPGARVLVHGTDLANTAARFTAHTPPEVREKLGLPAVLRDDPRLRMGLDILKDFETRTGLPLRQDLFWNALGGRAAIGVYAPARAAGVADVVLVGDVQDPPRFRAALAAVARDAAQSGIAFTPETVGGKPALRLARFGGHDLTAVWDGRLLVAGTRDDLVLGALALQAGSTSAPAGDAGLAAAFEALGPQNLGVVVRDDSTGAWSAHGFTWDRSGLHLELRAPAPPATGAPPHLRDAILKSLPDGLALGAYVHTDPSVLAGLREAWPRDWRPTEGGSDAAPEGGTGSAADFLGGAFQALGPWAGDEIGIALADVEATAVAAIPEIGFCIEVRDPEGAQSGGQGLEAALARLVGAAGGAFIDVRYGGRTFRSLETPISGTIAPSWWIDGDLAVVTTTRALAEQIVDTRRTGARSLAGDRAFAAARAFVPAEGVEAVVFVDHARVHAALRRATAGAALWGPRLRGSIAEMERVAALLQHFPSGVGWLQRDGERLVARGWVLEPR